MTCKLIQVPRLSLKERLKAEFTVFSSKNIWCYYHPYDHSLKDAKENVCWNQCNGVSAFQGCKKHPKVPALLFLKCNNNILRLIRKPLTPSHSEYKDTFAVVLNSDTSDLMLQDAFETFCKKEKDLVKDIIV